MKRTVILLGLWIPLLLHSSAGVGAAPGESQPVLSIITNVATPPALAPVGNLRMISALRTTNLLSGVRVTAGVNQTSGPAPLTVAFQATGSPPSAQYSTPARYFWSFGDGTTAVGQTPQHTYAQPGNYRAVVTYTRFINVIDPPEKTEQAAGTVLIRVGPPAAPARLEISPAEVSFAGQWGGRDPEVTVVRLSNPGGKQLTWSTGPASGTWLRVSPVRGNLPPGTSTQLVVSVAASGLAPGAYQSQLTLRSREAVNQAVTLVARLNLARMVVTEPEVVPGKLELSPAEVAFAGEQGGRNPDSVPVKLSNSGGRRLAWLAERPSETWLRVDPQRGILPPGTSTQLLASAATAGLLAGSYRADVALRSGVSESAVLTLAASLSLTSPPAPARLAVFPAMLLFQRQERAAAPAPLSVTISNGGGRSLSWSASTEESRWLRLSSSLGTLAPGEIGEIQAIASTDGLAPGSYQSRIVFGSQEAGNSPLSLPAALIVFQPAPPLQPLGPEPAESGGQDKFPVIWIAVAALVLTGAGYAAYRKLVPPPFDIHPILSAGIQRIRAPGRIVAPFPRIRVYPGARKVWIRGPSPLIARITKLKEHRL